MGFAEEVRSKAAAPPRTNKYEWVLRELGDEADEFLDVLADPGIPPFAVREILLTRNLPVADTTISAWCRKARG